MRYSRKQKRSLKLRQKDYETMVAKPSFDTKGYRKPGSNKK